jgi:hypothetical protein
MPTPHLSANEALARHRLRSSFAYLTWQWQPDFWGSRVQPRRLSARHTATLAFCLCVPGLDDEQADMLGLVLQRLSLDSAGRSLFALDNVDDGAVLLADANRRFAAGATEAPMH